MKSGDAMYRVHFAASRTGAMVADTRRYRSLVRAQSRADALSRAMDALQIPVGERWWSIMPEPRVAEPPLCGPSPYVMAQSTGIERSA
jgi:hypothetical protein